MRLTHATGARYALAVIALTLSTGCDGPTPHFRGIEARTVTVEGSTFDIRRKGDVAEAIRTNSQYAPRMGPIARRAEIAIEQATGCRVTEVRGDAAVILGKLDCPG